MKVLLADDYPMTLEGYITILNNPNHSYRVAYNCKDVYKLLTQGFHPNVAVLDQNMEPSEEHKLMSGMDCAKYIRRHFPACKIIMITAHEESMILYNIYKQEIIDALIVKPDYTRDIFIYLIEENITESYYSKTAKKAIKELTQLSTLLESKNREILMYLSHGFKVSQLDNLVNLSLSAIKKRISKMFHEFGVTDSQELVQIARQRNLL